MKKQIWTLIFTLGLFSPLIAGAVDLTLYGFVHVDTVYIDSQNIHMGSGDRVFYLTGDRGENFNIHARQTRFGLKAAKEEEGLLLSGVIEVDFFGDEGQNASSEIGSLMRMRNAYVSARKGSHVLLAGQAGDVLAPLLPDTFDFSLGLYTGNIGFWRPQIRYEQMGWDPVRFQVSLNRGYNKRENTGRPDAQARVSVQSLRGEAGLSGLYGRGSQTKTPDPATGEKGAVQSLALDARIHLKPFTVSGEIYIGENLEDYFGLSKFKQKENGGWLELKYKRDRWTANTGHIRAKIKDSSRVALADRLENHRSYVNVRYALTKSLSTGLEYAYLETVIKALPTRQTYNANRINWMVHYDF